MEGKANGTIASSLFNRVLIVENLLTSVPKEAAGGSACCENLAIE